MARIGVLEVLVLLQSLLGGSFGVVVGPTLTQGQRTPAPTGAAIRSTEYCAHNNSLNTNSQQQYGSAGRYHGQASSAVGSLTVADEVAERITNLRVVTSALVATAASQAATD